MDVFALRDHLIHEYHTYISSFIQIRDPKLRSFVNQSLSEGLLWPDPLIQLNPAFEQGHTIDELVDEGLLHPSCKQIFRRKNEGNPYGNPLRLHKHQEDAVRTARQGQNYVLTTGTGSGKSLAYIIPVVDYVLHNPGKGIKAIIVYPMNALANSQMGELNKFINLGFPDNKGPVTFERYTGQEKDDEKKRIMANPPDILLTNYVMLELILTRPEERQTLVNAAQGLRFLVLDELHTYRGRQGADVAMLVRRVRNALNATNLQCVGTSATLAGAGTLDEQRAEVADVALQLFGDRVSPLNIISETLRRSTPETAPNDSGYLSRLSQRAAAPQAVPVTYEELRRDPLASWIESNLGVTSDSLTGRLVRVKPRSILGKEGAALQLSKETGVSEMRCADALMRLLLAGYHIDNPDTGLPTFAFRLHQFISRGDTVYASLEPEAQRYLTVNGQQFVPGDRGRILLPLAFCRECGQEYYVISRAKDKQTGVMTILPRDLLDRPDEITGEPGYLYLSSDDPWPATFKEILDKDKLPEDWLEERDGELRLRANFTRIIPQNLTVDACGQTAEQGLTMQFIPAPFRMCLHCGVTYGARQASDYAKLNELSSGGRSTDTTILSIALLRNLRVDESLKKEARKLLSFTDNRQDASLQAGHFNDFIEIALLRAAIFKAVQKAGAEGLTHEMLARRVFDALALPFEHYAIDATVEFAQKNETQRALREVLGYRIYRDLKRGWRLTSPNLEQCGLLQIEYISLDEVCAAEKLWEGAHPALSGASPDVRQKVCKVLLDYMRRSLAIKVDYLNPEFQESIKQLSSQKLRAPWKIDEGERISPAAILFPRSRRKEEENSFNAFLSARGGFGQYLRRSTTFPDHPDKINLVETALIIQHIMAALRRGGLVESVWQPRNPEEVSGYQIPAASLVWRLGDGKQAFHDPISVPRLPEGGGRTNPFFVDFYQVVASELLGLEAHEHTAQVPSDIRQEREQRFRIADLPILYCSPTMELGVDIAELNAVNMRNVPPTPANYAQRSGRSGRSGQPALVFTYATIGSPHDQYYFKRPTLMVSGAVTPPRLDLANEDLIRSHVYAVWLAETNLSLGRSLKDLLDLTGDDPTLQLLPNVLSDLDSDSARKKAIQRAHAILSTIQTELEQTDWHSITWLDSMLQQLPRQFDQACERWRNLYRAAKGQQRTQQKIIDDIARSADDRRIARRLRQEAESQIELLTDVENVMQSDFYSYRYFASEGFLPGYSFPRLPLSAYIPGRRGAFTADEYLSRPRFLAIAEFGPRALIYHEGSRYLIHKVNLPIAESGSQNGPSLVTQRAKQCPTCGYFHPITNGDGHDLCERCGAPFQETLERLFRMQNVSTRRRDRISSDEEERMRQGFELRTAVRFYTATSGQPAAHLAELVLDGQPLARLTYANAASIWRINLGWRRRADKNQKGFLLDIERGYWAKQADVEDEADDPLSARIERVIPFVEDTKNCLLFEPIDRLDLGQMASLQAALKSAIQVHYQLEDDELAAEPLPDANQRSLILFYEAAEGGAGVLHRLLDDPQAFREVAREALQLCHFEPDSGADQRRAPGAREDCEAACYDCLMSYFNQVDHRRLDRQAIKDLLLQYSQAELDISPAPVPRAAHLEGLRNLCQSELEREWLNYLEAHQYHLPTYAQKLNEACGTRPDFYYETERAVIYIDGYHHLYPERQERDLANVKCLQNLGYTVLRFGLLDDWQITFEQYPALFGIRKV